ncbi:MAG: hypothetical protein AB1894_09775 [Chloroflexota bacterium]
MLPKFSFADQAQAGQILAERDVFIESLSPFDRAARLRSPGPVAEADFLEFLRASAQSWQPAERKHVEATLEIIAEKDWLHQAGGNLPFPPEIVLVKTNGQEEAHCAYTRGNAIILPPRKLAYPSLEDLARLVTHEMFHILSRYNPALRQALYAVIGFRPCNGLEYPTELWPRKITNPDAPHHQHYIQVRCDEQAVNAVPIHFSSQATCDPQRGGDHLDSLLLRLLVIERQDRCWRPARCSGQLRLLEMAQVSGLYEQTGRNSQALHHPEEILAENFAHLVWGTASLPSPWVIESAERVLREYTRSAPERSLKPTTWA